MKGAVMGDLRTQKTLSSLKNAFLHLLEQYRFEEITIQQLCTCANIRRATFYTHFADKYEFLSFFIQEIRKELIECTYSLNHDSHQDDYSYYDNLFHELVLFFENHPQLVRNLKSSQMLPTMMEIFVEVVQKDVFCYLKTQSTTEDESMLEMKAYFYAGGIVQLLQLWIATPNQFKIDEINWLKLFV